MSSRLLRDPVYLGCTLAVAAVVLVSFGLRPWVDNDLLKIRPATALLSLLIVLGLLFRARGGLRAAKTLIGLFVTLACGLQLAMFVIAGTVEAGPGVQAVGQNFAGGMFCLGMALVIDGVLPSHWGRHLVFGLIGAVVAGIGVFGLFELVGLRRDLGFADEDLLVGMRLPSALILVFGGIALLAGARLRGAPIESGFHASPHPDSVRDRTGLAAALAMLLITLGATALIWREAQMQAWSREHARAQEALDRFDDALVAHALGVAALLDGVRGLFAASRDVTGSEWKEYLRHVRQQGRPATVAVLFARELAPAPGSDAVPRFDVDGTAVPIRPGGVRERYAVVTYVSPDTDVMRRLVGLDIGADDGYRAILEVARDEASIGVSAPIDFSRHGDPLGRTGFAVVRSVHGQAPGDAGFVYAMVDMAAVVEQAYRDSGSSLISVRARDVSAGAAGSLLYRAADFVDSGTPLTATFDLGGRRWQVDAHVRDAAAGQVGASVSMLVLGGGSLVALALFAITWVLAGHRARALNLASRMTAELRRSQREQQAITDTANAGIVTADGSGRILYMNPAASLIFGVEPSTMAGKPLTDLVPERHRGSHLLGIERARLGQSPNIVGRAVESVGMRSDGSEFPVEILASAWSSDGQAYFTGFVRDISERKRQEQMLVQKTRELERSNAELEQFAYVASHDLQEPLRMVASYVQLLARRYRGHLDKDADEFIGFAVDGATRMQHLIQDLLAYARVGRSGKHPIPVHIGHCAEAARSALQEAIVESGARVAIAADGVAVAVPSQLTQLLQNLIGNAIKFRGDAAPAITIDAQRDGGFWHVRVADNGIGIEPQHRERVFAIFQRLHTRREYPGTGIGLAICRKIVEGFGGRIWVESESGKGSVFHFTVPASEESA